MLAVDTTGRPHPSPPQPPASLLLLFVWPGVAPAQWGSDSSVGCRSADTCRWVGGRFESGQEHDSARDRPEVLTPMERGKNVMTTTTTVEPAQLDMGAPVEGWAIELIGTASTLMGVPLATEATACARPGEPYGALLAEQLAHADGDTFASVMALWPGLLDANRADDPMVVGAVELIESTVDRLIAASFDFAGMAGGVR